MQRGRNEPLAADTAAVARAVHATEGPASVTVVFNLLNISEKGLTRFISKRDILILVTCSA